MGITMTTDQAAVERHVEEIRGIYRTRFGRELLPDEVAAVRKGGELRAQTGIGGRDFQSTRELAAVMNWGLVVEPRDHASR